MYYYAASLLCSVLHSKLEDVFSKFDTDGSRALDKAEFARAFALMGLTLSAEQIEEMFAVSEWVREVCAEAIMRVRETERVRVRVSWEKVCQRLCYHGSDPLCRAD